MPQDSLPQTLYQQGLEQIRSGDLLTAIATFDQVLQLQPDFPEAYYQRGLARFKLGNLPNAVTDYTRALLSPVNQPTDKIGLYYARSLAQLSIGQTEAAIADAKQIILLQANHAAAYHLLAKARQQQGDVKKAILSYKKAAECYLDQQDIVNCRRCLESIRRLQPAPPNATETVATGTLPLTPETFLQQSLEKAAQRNYGGALEDLDWALQLDPSDVQAYIYRGQLRAELGDRWGAKSDYRQAAQIAIDHADRTTAQQMLDRIQQLNKLPPPVSRPVSPYPTNVIPFPGRRSPAAGKPSPAVQKRLLQLVGDDRRIVAGLVERLRDKHPGMPEDWYWEKAIYDLERDRR